MFLFFAIACGISLCWAQSGVVLRFTGGFIPVNPATSFNKYVQLSEVSVSNSSQGWSEKLVYPDTVIVFTADGIEDMEHAKQFALKQNVPNPFEGKTKVSLFQPESGDVTLNMFDLTGRLVATFSSQLAAGEHQFDITANVPQAYLLTATSAQGASTIKMFCSVGGQANHIGYDGEVTHNNQLKKIVTKPFTPGDNMAYNGYAQYNGESISAYTISHPQTTSEDFVLEFQWDARPCFGMPTVTDYDKNVYNTVQLGHQCWMKENLRTTHYADGSSIGVGSTVSTTTPYRFYPDGNSANVPKYGYLYNWPAVMHGSRPSDTDPSGVQGICPTGWHVPSEAECEQLSRHMKSAKYHDGSSYYLDYYRDDLTLVTMLASQEGWKKSSEEGGAGYNMNVNNKTKFTAMPAGSWYNGSSGYFGEIANFYTSTMRGSEEVVHMSLSYNGASLGFPSHNASLGYSVRCLRD